MSADPDDRSGRVRRTPLAVLISLESVCVVAFALLLHVGNLRMALLAFIVPLQLLVLVLAFQDDFLLLQLFAAISPLTGMGLLPTVYGRHLLNATTIGLAFFLVLTRFVGGKQSRPARLAVWERLPMAVLAGSMLLAAANAFRNGWWSSELARATLMGLMMLLAAWLFATIPRSLAQVRRLVYTFGVAVTAACVAMFLMPAAVGEGGALGGKSIMAPFHEVNLNAFAALVGIGLSLLLGALLDENRFPTRLCLLGCILILVVGLVYTRSRGAWLGFGAAYLYVLFRARSVWFTSLAGVGLLTMIAVESLRTILLVRAGETTLADPSLLGRFRLWLYAWKVFVNNWLVGVGFLNYRLVKHSFGFPQPMWFAQRYNAHNIYLELLADLGVTGFASYIALTLGAWFRTDRVARRSAPTGRGIAVGLGAAIVFFSVHGLLDAVIWQQTALMALGVLVGLAISARRLVAPVIPGETLASTGAG